MSNKAAVEYSNRDELDGELQRAVSDILSAEESARAIIEQANVSVKSVQLDCAAQERTLREAHARQLAADRDAAVADAIARADKECARIVAAAQKKGEELIKSKRGDISRCAEELFKSLGGK